MVAEAVPTDSNENIASPQDDNSTETKDSETGAREPMISKEVIDESIGAEFISNAYHKKTHVSLRNNIQDTNHANYSAANQPDGPTLETRREKIEKFEIRYMKLLEEKIARLEEEANEDSESDNSVYEDNDAHEKEIDEAEPPVEKQRVRYYELRRDIYHRFTDHVVEKPDLASEKAKDDDFAIAWRLPGSGESDHNPKLLIESQALRKVLKEVDNGCSSFPFDTEVVAMPWPYELIYHKESRLLECAKEADEVTKGDIEILIEEVTQQQSTERKDAERLAKDGQITFDLLWTLFYPGDLVVQKNIMGKEQVCVIATHGLNNKLVGYDIDLWSVDYDGTNFICLERCVTIKQFKGAKAITDLEIFPLKKWASPDGTDYKALEQRLIKRGRKFEKLCNGPPEGSFRQYAGLMVNHGTVEMLADRNGDSQDDTGATSTSAGGLEIKTKGGMGNLEQNSLVIIGEPLLVSAEENKSHSNADHDGYFNKAKKQMMLGDKSTYDIPCTCILCTGLRKEVIRDLPNKVDPPQKIKAMEDIQCLLCPPRVFGFTLRSKLWAQLLVDNVEDIDQQAKEEAWKRLELDRRNKEILETLIKQHAKDVNPLEDIIPGKGEGLIVLLHGPPGVGKTLTAESLAKLTNKPLFSVSMTDVGTSPVVVEKNLLRVFELATHWKALLLFDEADIFLETRSLQDLVRNSLVSVLLRILEYFKGILFLTSNRVKTFDEAFSSRINVTVRYKDLTEPQRKRVWTMWLDRAQDDIQDRREFDEQLEEGMELVKAELNGRQIRNVFRSALSMARSRALGDQQLKLSDVERVLKRTMEFQSYMLQNKELAEKQGIR